jgi:hypothetical protein
VTSLRFNFRGVGASAGVHDDGVAESEDAAFLSVSYFRHTIPVTYFSTGYSVDYHQATDEPQYIDYEKSARVGRFVHEIMHTVAQRPTRLRILPMEERDLSAQCGR